MSNAKAFKFKHNNLEDLAQKLEKLQETKNEQQEIYVVTESVFSMDGDSPQLAEMIQFCNDKNIYLIVDEAHAIGVFGANGQGLLQELHLETEVFARIYTFGKGLGCHGAVILGSETLKTYLINFARSFIYTTGLSPHAVATIKIAYQELAKTTAVAQLRKNIEIFQKETTEINFTNGNAAIHCCIIAGNETVKKVAKQLQTEGFDVKPILSPTVPKGKERLRFCLHAYNTEAEIKEVISALKNLTHELWKTNFTQ